MKKRRLFWLLPLLLLLIPIPVVSELEERDRFCIACHTQPEETYYNRAQAALAEPPTAVDLTSQHYRKAEEAFRCIDCHRGDNSLSHRARTLALGARDTLIWISGQADPTLEKGTAAAPELLNAGCVDCHPDTLLITGFNNHFHNMLPPAHAVWQAGGDLLPPRGQPELDENATIATADTTVTCIDCHESHVTISDPEFTLFLDLENVVFPACVQCHEEEGHGPLDLDVPGQ